MLLVNRAAQPTNPHVDLVRWLDLHVPAKFRRSVTGVWVVVVVVVTIIVAATVAIVLVAVAVVESLRRRCEEK